MLSFHFKLLSALWHNTIFCDQHNINQFAYPFTKVSAFKTLPLGCLGDKLKSDVPIMQILAPFKVDMFLTVWASTVGMVAFIRDVSLIQIKIASLTEKSIYAFSLFVAESAVWAANLTDFVLLFIWLETSTSLRQHSLLRLSQDNIKYLTKFLLEVNY